ncbi:hypothetical protein ANO11243_080250 [Dothideomycetidae sp. 11243]|nr:hypothetical protein ANO11243_080250 [fungal sp. No.11243]
MSSMLLGASHPTIFILSIEASTPVWHRSFVSTAHDDRKFSFDGSASGRILDPESCPTKGGALCGRRVRREANRLPSLSERRRWWHDEPRACAEIARMRSIDDSIVCSAAAFGETCKNLACRGGVKVKSLRVVVDDQWAFAFDWTDSPFWIWRWEADHECEAGHSKKEA